MTQAPIPQLTRFRQAVTLLGGTKAACRALGVSTRMVTYLLAGDKPLTTRHLRAIGKALLLHADTCRLIERTLSPDFTGNLTDRQTNRTPSAAPTQKG